jgi:uncharacterized protein (DUF1330 family)
LLCHGGRYLVRGAAADVPEGDWPTRQRVVLVEFPNREQLRSWYSLTDYVEALAVGRIALDRRVLVAEGVPSPSANRTASAAPYHQGPAIERSVFVGRCGSVRLVRGACVLVPIV